jgi:hypothetical protein
VVKLYFSPQCRSLNDDLLDIGLQANGATAWGFIAEISSERLRHYTAGFSAAVGAAIGIAMNELVPYMVNKN